MTYEQYFSYPSFRPQQKYMLDEVYEGVVILKLLSFPRRQDAERVPLLLLQSHMRATTI